MDATGIGFAPTIPDLQVAPLRPTHAFKRFPKDGRGALPTCIGLREGHQHASAPRSFQLLRAHSEWRTRRRAADQPEKVPPSHVRSQEILQRYLPKADIRCGGLQFGWGDFCAPEVCLRSFRIVKMEA
jgi:hypothetical protein